MYEIEHNNGNAGERHDKDGVSVLWSYEEGWLVYEYTGRIKGMYPARRAWVGHRCSSAIKHPQGCGFVSAELQEPRGICSWCDTVIPPEVQGVTALYNYGKEGERHDNQG